MKKNMKWIVLFAAMLPMAIACNSIATADAENSATAHTHSFTCPMHPEVTGKEGDTCPKCGMKLEHSDAPVAAAGSYFMQFAATPAVIASGKDVALSFIPKNRNAEGEQVALDIEHEKKIHLILVSEDLSWFDHIHPEYTSSGSYVVTEKFPAGGNYIAFADYKPAGAGHVVDKFDLKVSGKAPASKIFSDNKLSGNSGAYSFELVPAAGRFITGTTMHIAGVVKNNGQPVDANTLENYLGAKAHFVMISLNDKEYMHVHPNVENGRFDLHTTFSKPGIYRGWVQFNADGSLHTIDFTIKVTAGTPAEIEAAKQGHEPDAHSHSHH
ncbi:MAG TPA: heavy metal-binding domain-containing protein [Chitinophagaceae bacterium]